MRLLDIVYIFQTYHISVLFKIVQLKLGERVSNRMISMIKKKKTDHRYYFVNIN